MKLFSNFIRGFICAAAFLLTINKSQGATCVALASGDWGNAANWSCGAVPSCGDSIVIPAGKTVSITNNYNYSACGPRMAILVSGTLVFVNGKKIQLPCNSNVYVAAGGQITSSGGGGSNNQIEICGAVVWTADMGVIDGPSCMPPSINCSYFLPIELTDFFATVNLKTIDLTWITASEKNNDKYEIESSADASNYKKITEVKSKAYNGNSTTRLDYQYRDSTPTSGLSYYRLKQIDKDKTFTYSPVISVVISAEKNIKFTIYPNPNQGEFTADVSGIENNHNVVIMLADNAGRLVYKSNFFIQDPGSNKFHIVPDTKLSNGVYICTLMIEEIAFKVKVVVS